MIWTALIAMMVAYLAQHLGLPQALAVVIAKVAKCPKCFTFWITLIVLLIVGGNILIVIMLAVLMAYASYYWGLVIMWMQKKYGKLWQSISKKK